MGKSIIDDALDKLKQESYKYSGNENVIEKKKFNRKIVGVYGGSGGVGVSSFIENLAVMFAKNDFSVLIIEGNLLLPFHQLYYYNVINNNYIDSFSNLPSNNIDNLYKIIVKSNVSEKISYCNQQALNLVDLVKLDEDFNNFNETENKLLEYRKFYDVILIDLCPLLLSNCIEQGFLKNCDYLINIITSDVTINFNKNILNDLIKLTAKNNVEILTIENKVKIENIEPLYLPYETYYNECYNEAKSFLLNGKSENDTYMKNFQIIYETIVNNLYKG